MGLGETAQVLKLMIEDSFTPETGIAVELELVTAMQSLLVPQNCRYSTGCRGIGLPNMDLAFKRRGVVDLTPFDDFGRKVAQRFMKSALLTFRFRDKVFALPEAQSFPMLFYRKDVLAELGLEVPQTWEDVYAIIPELQEATPGIRTPRKHGYVLTCFPISKGCKRYTKRLHRNQPGVGGR